ncbi:MAG: T9SS type A sorting domain-containing protein [Bacteroidota bacterium]
MKYLILSGILAFGIHFLNAQSFDIVGPAGSENFGADITVLPNGNYIIVDSGWDNGIIEDVGAVYLYDGSTNTLISTLRGSTAGDQVGSNGVTVLSNGNYVVSSPNWDNGTAEDAGAVTWVDAALGINTSVNNSNSLVGSTTNDFVGGDFGSIVGITVLPNGNYVVISPQWDNSSATDAGAVTWGNGATGISGLVNVQNSLVGSTTNDRIGDFSITVLSNDNYVVFSRFWDNGIIPDAGAVTWGNGAVGTSGLISAQNSLVGSTAFDEVGNLGIFALTNGNYVVRSTKWDNEAVTDAGAVTWGNGTTGTSGVVNAQNSLIGSSAFDEVGSSGIVILPNGNYVISSKNWDNELVTDAGAVTWGDGTLGVSGLVNPQNSLVGSTTFDEVGSFGVTALSNGNYVVRSSRWDNGAVNDTGAVTWGDGVLGVRGPVSITNSLVGSMPFDLVGNSGVTALPNGNYVIASPSWDNGRVVNAGAVTWVDGTIGLSGKIDSSNSLVGNQTSDEIGSDGIIVLKNNNYVVNSREWNNGTARNAGAITWGNGTTGISGVVDSINSLVGSTANDQIGKRGIFELPNGNYVVSSPFWDDGAISGVGAVTWGSGVTGVRGVVSSSNSLIGSRYNDNVGNGGVTILSNGNYVVRTPTWNPRTLGAATWGDGTTGVSGVVSSSNSLIGSRIFDQVGRTRIFALSNGNYVVSSSIWDNESTRDAGAATWGDGSIGISGTISSDNSLVGDTANDNVGLFGVMPISEGNYFVKNFNWGSRDVRNLGAVTWGNGITGINGFINTCNSVLGNIADQGSSLNPIFNEISKKLLVGKPAENIITVYDPTAIVLADNLDNKTLSISGIGEANFITEDCELIASLATVGANPVNGNTAATVWVADVQPTDYAKRYYEVFPENNPTTTTGKLSLYFTQAEFDDFNAVSSVKLPQNPSDTIGIANLIIEKRLGKSSDGTGLPDSYSGEVSDIDPDDGDILWNAQEMRWEVSFGVTGWGGFFLKAKASTIPDLSTLIFDLCNLPFTASFSPVENAVAYQVEITIPMLNNRVITRRINEAMFSSNLNIPDRVLGSAVEIRVAAIFFDENTSEETVGEFSESQTIVLECDEAGNLILENRSSTFAGLQLYPNPANDAFTIEYNSPTDGNLQIQILDLTGKVLFEENNRLQIGENRSTYSFGHLAAGTYILKVQSGQRVEQVKVVKL